MPEKRFEMTSTISKTINSGKKIDAKHCNCVYIAGNDITIGVRDFEQPLSRLQDIFNAKMCFSSLNKIFVL